MGAAAAAASVEEPADAWADVDARARLLDAAEEGRAVADRGPTEDADEDEEEEEAAATEVRLLDASRGTPVDGPAPAADVARGLSEVLLRWPLAAPFVAAAAPAAGAAAAAALGRPARLLLLLLLLLLMMELE